MLDFMFLSILPILLLVFLVCFSCWLQNLANIGIYLYLIGVLQLLARIPAALAFACRPKAVPVKATFSGWRWGGLGY